MSHSSTLIVLALVATQAGAVRFETTDPMVWVESSVVPEAGVNETFLDIRVLCECELDETNWNSAHDVRRMAYERHRDLCQQDCKSLRELLLDISHCLPGVRRQKRIAPLVVAGGAVTVALGGKMAYRQWYPGSDLNRIISLEDRERAMNATVQDLREDYMTIRGSLDQTLDGAQVGLRRTSENQQAIKHIAAMTPDLVWSGAKLAIGNQRKRDALAKIRDRCQDRQLSLEGLRLLTGISDFRAIRDKDTLIQDVFMQHEDTVSMRILINVPRPNAIIYKVAAISHYANYTTDPVYVKYDGPEYVYYDGNNDCAKGVEVTQEQPVYEQCTQGGYRDPRLSKWVPMAATEEEIEKRSKPIVIRMGNSNIIYCLYHKITIVNTEYLCPPMPFKLPRTLKFNLTGTDFEVHTQYLMRTNQNTKIKTPVLANMTDEEYNQQTQAFLNIRERKLKSVPTDKWGYFNGSLVLPSNWLAGLSVVASVLTIWRYCPFRRRSKASSEDGGASHSEHEERRESHAESIRIYNGSRPIEHQAADPQELLVNAIGRMIVGQLQAGGVGIGPSAPHIPPLPRRPPPPVPGNPVARFPQTAA